MWMRAARAGSESSAPRRRRGPPLATDSLVIASECGQRRRPGAVGTGRRCRRPARAAGGGAAERSSSADFDVPRQRSTSAPWGPSKSLPELARARTTWCRTDSTYVFNPQAGRAHQPQRPAAQRLATRAGRRHARAAAVQGVRDSRPTTRGRPPVPVVAVDAAVLRGDESTGACYVASRPAPGTQLHRSRASRSSSSTPVLEIRAAFEAKLSCKLTAGRTPPLQRARMGGAVPRRGRRVRRRVRTRAASSPSPAPRSAAATAARPRR